MPRFNRPISREAVERVCRVYRTSRDAAAAREITRVALNRLCRRYGLETPHTRHRREVREARAGTQTPD